MTARTKYDFERLDKYCKENGVTLVEDYRNTYLDGKVKIKGKCVYENCENEFEKKFDNLVKTGSYCKICIKIMTNKRRKEFCLEKYGHDNITKTDGYKEKIISTKFTFDLLQEFCKSNNISLSENYENEKLHAHYFIKGKCSYTDCINIFSKKFCKLINFNSLCKSCSIQHAKEVRKETNLKTIGVENYFQNAEVKNKMKATNLKKYGVEYTSQNPEVQNKMKATCLNKYGFSHPSYDKNFQNKIKETNLKKYGVEHLMQNPEYLENMLKKSHKFKDYTMPSGNIIKYQGYENIALDELIINEKIDETDIITGAKNVPNIFYNDENGVKRIHFVDIFIPSQNRCIEVKSTWTFNKPNVLYKQKSAKELGYNYEIWMYDKKGNKICYD
jgi:hypothetical protein